MCVPVVVKNIKIYKNNNLLFVVGIRNGNKSHMLTDNKLKTRNSRRIIELTKN